MKLYIHQENILHLLGIACLAVVWAVITKIEGSLAAGVFGVMFFAFLFVLTIARMWKFRHDEKIEDNVYKRVILKIGENELRFPRGYYFEQSSICKSRRVPANIISEMNTGQRPPSCVINDNEVLFLKYDQKDELIDFARRNDIPLVDRHDLWSYICEPFLDTEITGEEDKFNLDRLNESGIEPSEIAAIRKKVKWSMLGLTYAKWEWQHYGHQDVLMASFRSKKKYWWTMGIALRNYKKKYEEKMPA